MRRLNQRFTLWRGVVAGTALAGVVVGGGWGMADSASGKDSAVLERVRFEIIPAAGTDTAYGIPLDLASLPEFIAWRDAVVLTEAQAQTAHDALVQIPAPCCDDNTAFQCCCEKGGQRCNLVTSGKGLAAYLVQEKGFAVEETRDAVRQWFHFVRPDYYVALALQGEGLDPGAYGLTLHGSCYRGMCEVPISQGGCGGMGRLIEPALDGPAS